MKPLRFSFEWTHTGRCEHFHSQDPEQIIFLESHMWGRGAQTLICRFADVPWDALFAWHEAHQIQLQWFTANQMHLN